MINIEKPALLTAKPMLLVDNVDFFNKRKAQHMFLLLTFERDTLDGTSSCCLKVAQMEAKGRHNWRN